MHCSPGHNPGRHSSPGRPAEEEATRTPGLPMKTPRCRYTSTASPFNHAGRCGLLCRRRPPAREAVQEPEQLPGGRLPLQLLCLLLEGHVPAAPGGVGQRDEAARPGVSCRGRACPCIEGVPPCPAHARGGRGRASGAWAHRSSRQVRCCCRCSALVDAAGLATAPPTWRRAAAGRRPAP